MSLTNSILSDLRCSDVNYLTNNSILLSLLKFSIDVYGENRCKCALWLLVTHSVFRSSVSLCQGFSVSLSFYDRKIWSPHISLLGILKIQEACKSHVQLCPAGGLKEQIDPMVRSTDTDTGNQFHLLSSPGNILNHSVLQSVHAHL